MTDSKKPTPITQEQLERIYAGIGSEGFAYYFCDYTSPKSLKLDPESEVAKCWTAFEQAKADLEKALESDLEHHGLTSEDMEY